MNDELVYDSLMENSIKKTDSNEEQDDQELNLLELNLSLTPEERILKHQKALNLLNELIRVRENGERS